MVPENIHDFFLGSAGVAGALIGLLFVALSVAAPRLAHAEASAQVHRVRAGASLTSFVNTLTVSLFALIPGQKIGWTCVAVSCVGLLFVAASLSRLLRLPDKHWATARDAAFLVGMAVGFVLQMLAGLSVAGNPADASDVQNIAILVVVFFLAGISRAWELVGGPAIGPREQLATLLRGGAPGEEEMAGERAAADEPGAAGPGKPAAEAVGQGAGKPAAEPAGDTD